MNLEKNKIKKEEERVDPRSSREGGDRNLWLANKFNLEVLNLSSAGSITWMLAQLVWHLSLTILMLTMMVKIKPLLPPSHWPFPFNQLYVFLIYSLSQTLYLLNEWQQNNEPIISQKFDL